MSEVSIGVGYRAEAIAAEVGRSTSGLEVDLVHNPDYQQGNVVTLWHLAERLEAGGSVLLMDADVLYHRMVMERLVASDHANCFLMDRDIEPGEEPVKLCVRDGRIVEFRKLVDPALAYDYHGESVGFFKLSEAMARALAETVRDYVARGRREEFYEEALRDLVLGEHGPRFGFEDITGLPWVEIDFPEDVDRAHREVLPRMLSTIAEVSVTPGPEGVPSPRAHSLAGRDTTAG